MRNVMDRLWEEVEQKGPVCLGLDTDVDYLPKEILEAYPTVGEAIFAFNKGIIDATLDVTAVYKVQIAYYEALGLAGLKAYSDTMHYLREKGAITIADVKRGDIAKTAEMYAKGHFTGDFEADILTINPFMGLDTLEPFFPYLEKGKGLFALLATSNPGAQDIEYQLTSTGKRLYEVVGEKLTAAGKPYLGVHGYSAIGAVVACTDKQTTKQMRDMFPTLYFLIPGYGAQGGTADEMEAYFDDDNNGSVVNSSRGILLAYRNERYKGLDYAKAARAEVEHMAKALNWKDETK